MIGAIIAKRRMRSAFGARAFWFLACWREDATWVYLGKLSVSGRIEGKKAIFVHEREGGESWRISK